MLTQYIYDSMGRQAQVIHPDATSTYTVYNVKGQVITEFFLPYRPAGYAKPLP